MKTQPTITGVTMIRNGVKYDYCFEETIKCLLSFCDETIVVMIQGEDKTEERVLKLLSEANERGENTKAILVSSEIWEEEKGKEKLSVFSNIGLNAATSDYVFYLQCDEVLTDDSLPFIYEAMLIGKNGYAVHRINLWGDCNHELNVKPERLPCSEYVHRLAKKGALCVGDAESLAIDNVSAEYTNFIEIVHYGFVRKKEVMKAKIINMQENVFGIDHDKKLDQSEVFDSTLWFDKDDLKPISVSHPRIMREWVKIRP